MSKHFIALRVRPLRKWSDVAAATEHGQRTRRVDHVDLARSHLNEHFEYDPESGGLAKVGEPADITAAFRRRAEQLGARWHKTAIVGTEIMFIASPKFFTGGDSTCDLSRAHRWAGACLKAWEGLFPGQSVVARLDLDETTPHLSVFFLPLHLRHYRSETRRLKNPCSARLTISHNKTFGEANGPDILSMLQNWIAAEMQAAGFDLKRGLRVDETGATNKTPAAGRRAVAAARQLAAEIAEIARQNAADRRLQTELEINSKLIEVSTTIDAVHEKLHAEDARNRTVAEELQGERAVLDAEWMKLREAQDKLLQRIQTLDRVMHDIACELGVTATGTFWSRLKSIADAIDERRGGGGPAYRPG